MPAQRSEIVDTSQERERVIMAMPINARDLEFQERAARRRDPQRRLDAQAMLDAAPKVNVILDPTPEDQAYGESHLDADGNPIYPKWRCRYNGLDLAYPVGEPIEMPSYIWEQFAHSRRRPVFRKEPGEHGVVFSREIPDDGAQPSFGR